MQQHHIVLILPHNNNMKFMTLTIRKRITTFFDLKRSHDETICVECVVCPEQPNRRVKDKRGGERARRMRKENKIN